MQHGGAARATAYVYYLTSGDPELADHAYLWDDLRYELQQMDDNWAFLIGAFPYAHDAVVPLSKQQYPGATNQENFAFPEYDIAHREQKFAGPIRDYMVDVFIGTFGVDSVPPPPPPPSDPLEVELFGPDWAPEWSAEGCAWYAAASGGSGTKAYSWVWDGQPHPPPYPGEQWWNGTTTHGYKWLEVTVTDASGSAYDAMQVFVDQNTEWGNCI